MAMSNQPKDGIYVPCVHARFVKHGKASQEHVTKGLAPSNQAKFSKGGLKEKCTFLFLSLAFGKRHTFSLFPSSKVWPTWLKKVPPLSCAFNA